MIHLKKIHVYFLLASGVCALAVAGTFLARSRSSENIREVPIAGVSKRSFDRVVNTVGVVDAARSYMISSSIRGDRGKIIYLIEDGTKVETGDVLMRMDPTPFEEDIQRIRQEIVGLQSAVEASRQMLEWEKNQMEREIRAAEFNLKVAKLERNKLTEGDGPLQIAQYKEETDKMKEEYDRYRLYISDLEQLAQDGYSILTEITAAKKKASELKIRFESVQKKLESYQHHVFPSLVEAASAGVEKAAIELEQIKKGSVFKIAKAVAAYHETQNKLRIAEDALTQAQEELKKTVIEAPFPGIAVLNESFWDGQRRKPRIGDRVLQNQPLLYLPDISSMIVKTQVREVDLHKIALNQRCTVKMDAYPDMTCDGIVTFIGVLATGRFDGALGEKYFQITVAIKGENLRLRPGMTARVVIWVDRVTDALAVPVHTIFYDNGIPYCYKRIGNKFQLVSVSVGRQNEDWAEITSGLNPDDQISLIKPPQKDMLTD